MILLHVKKFLMLMIGIDHIGNLRERHSGTSRHLVWALSQIVYVTLRATSHTSQELWPWNFEIPKTKCPKAAPTHPRNHVVWSQAVKASANSYLRPCPQPTAISKIFHSCRSSHMIKIEQSMVVNVWNGIVSQFGVRPTLQEMHGYWK